MACAIGCKKEPILKISNIAMDWLHQAFFDQVAHSGLNRNASVVHFVSSLDQDRYGGCGIIDADIEKSFGKDPQALGELIKILDKVFEEFFLQIDYNEELAERLTKFRQAIMAYYEEIS